MPGPTASSSCRAEGQRNNPENHYESVYLGDDHGIVVFFCFRSSRRAMVMEAVNALGSAEHAVGDVGSGAPGQKKSADPCLKTSWLTVSACPVGSCSRAFCYGVLADSLPPSRRSAPSFWYPRLAPSAVLAPRSSPRCTTAISPWARNRQPVHHPCSFTPPLVLLIAEMIW